MTRFRLIIFTLFIALLAPVSASYSGIVLQAINIDTSEKLEVENKIKDLLPFRLQQETTPEQIESFVEQVRELALFKQIDYELKPLSKNGYQLILRIENGSKIRDLGVTGNYPMLGKDITRLIPLQPGTVFDENLIQESIDQITTYLKKYGYYDSKVRIKIKHIKKYNVYDLVIKLKKGKTYRVGNIDIKGNKVINSRRINNIFRHFTRFTEARLKNDLKKLKQIYANKGYIKARIKVGELVFDDVKKQVHLSFDIRENKKLKIQFTGKSPIAPNRLKSVTQLKSRRSYDRYAIRNGKNRLEKYFIRNGYPDVKITSEVLKPNKDLVIAQYHIDAGKRVEVKKIRIKGNKDLGSKKIKTEIGAMESELFSKAYFNRKRIVQNHIDMFRLYKEYGFFDVSVDAPEIKDNSFGDQKEVTFPVAEGTRYKIGKIEINTDLPVELAEINKKTKDLENKPFRSKDIAEIGNLILDNVQEQGFAFATLTPQLEINRPEKSANIVFNITRGKKSFVRHIKIDGHLKTKSKTIFKNLKIKSGDAFVYSKMLDAQLNLRKLGLFSSVRITPLGFDQKQKSIDLLVSVVERKTVITNMQAGIDSRNSFTGEFNFTKLNLFGGARQFNLRAIGGQRYSRGEMTFFSPRLFGASWNLSNQYFAQYEDQTNFDALSYGGFLNTLKNFGSHFTFGFKEQITRTDLYESKSNVAALGNALFDNTFNELQTTGILDFRDNFSDPQKGFLILARNELNTDLSDIKNNFNTLELNVSQFQGFLGRFTLVNTFRFGHTFKITQNARVPANKLFFLGGADTVRGFTEDGIDPSGGTVMMIYNGELHFKVTNAIKLAGFFDAGLLQDNINTINISDIRESAGAGFRYFTPIGPLRLDWGFILDRQTNEPKSRIHFSFGYFF